VTVSVNSMESDAVPSTGEARRLRAPAGEYDVVR